jgi:L-seryl-tRNA(Ser) seleniumtransferase
MSGDEVRSRLRMLPSVDQLAAAVVERATQGGDDASAGRVRADLARTATAAEVVSAARAVLERRRSELLDGAEDGPDLVDRAHERLRPRLRRVLNGTGVILHTNLGRAPLAESAVAAVAEAARGYVNLEYSLATGRRGRRDDHVAGLLCELTEAEDAMVVNNGAAAVLLAVAALAGPGTGVAVSRGQLVEIGGEFRIPDVVVQGGARLVEVGTTNRTRRSDYATALADGAQVILRVHQSNFRTVGFVEDVPIEDLCGLGVPVIDDVGSGAVALLDVFDEEPSIRDSLRAGSAVVCCSGDKLLGGPQVGIVVGKRAAVEACRRHPLARALRPGRLPIAALEATLALYRDPARALREIPVLQMLAVSDQVLAGRARRLADAVGGEVVPTVGRVGGGALPLLELRGPAVALDAEAGDAVQLASRLRGQDPPLMVRFHGRRVLVDPRTLKEVDLEIAIGVLRRALAELEGR